MVESSDPNALCDFLGFVSCYTYICTVVTCYRNTLCTHTLHSLAAFLPTLLRYPAFRQGLPCCKFEDRDLYKATCFAIHLYFCFNLQAHLLLLVIFGRTMRPCSLKVNSLYLCKTDFKCTERFLGCHDLLHCMIGIQFPLKLYVLLAYGFVNLCKGKTLKASDFIA